MATKTTGRQKGVAYMMERIQERANELVDLMKCEAKAAELGGSPG